MADQLDVLKLISAKLDESKLAWAKQSPSELQLRDVRAMIAVQRDLDWKYIDRWALRLTVTSLLTEVRS